MNSSYQQHVIIIDSIDPIWLSTLFLLGFVSIIGTIGNLLVLGVFIQHHFWPHLHLKYRHIHLNQKLNSLNTNELCTDDNNHYIIHIHESNEQLFNKTTGTPTFFILVLACVDLLVCCFVVPLTFYMEYIHLQPSNVIWCKTHAFLNICNIMFSSLLVIAIALERYLTICHPLRRILTMKRAKYLTLCLAIFCIIYGILGALHHTLDVTQNEPFIKQCCDTQEIFNATYLQLLTYDILQKGNTASFILSILSVIILYSLILNVVIKTHRYNHFSVIQQNLSYTTNNSRLLNNTKILNNNNNNNQIITHSSMNLNNTNVNNKNIEQLNKHRKSIGNKLKMNLSIKNIKESTLWRELRSASVLFVVAVVYIIVFTPALLTANKLVQFNLLAYNTYYLNNMSNPLIYCFMSNAFRKKLKILLFNSIISLKCCHNKPYHHHHHQQQQQQQQQQNQLQQQRQHSQLNQLQQRRKQYFRARQLINKNNNVNNNMLLKTNFSENKQTPLTTSIQ
ncbi:orexin receptor type 2-like [Schistosoma japonicum]|uniref:Orexin receptor type 2-like n=1 Tax=Schistosoma japonicum TaxID=6182 RepID=A0A4Z2DPY6_SCHJA|nr:orexin receptor type 2-like [Schistosoma japonicum]